LKNFCNISKLKNLKLCGFVLLSFFNFEILLAQTEEQKTDNNQLQQNIENLSENLETENIDFTALTELWTYFKAHPIHLNNTDAFELKQLQILNDIQINALLKHIEISGKLISIYELQGIDGFDLQTIEKILPYVFVDDKSAYNQITKAEIIKNIKVEWVSRIQGIFEKQKGYAVADSIRAIKPSSNSFYVGSPYRVFSRIKVSVLNNFSAALVADKDAGEDFFKGSNKKGFDFYCGHIAIRNLKYVKSFIIGDYQASFGQGLTLWNGFGFGKTSQAIAIKRNALGFKPYNSTDESRFFRGLATSLKYKAIELNLFYSSRKKDANITLVDSSDANNVEFLEASFISTSGLHNTNSTIQDRNSIKEHVFGGNVSYNKRQVHLGVTAQHLNYSAAINNIDQPYKIYNFSGKNNSVLGIDASYTYKNILLFGEGSMSANQGKAAIVGALLSLDAKFSLVGSYRYFEKNFQNQFAQAFTENTFPQNEKGIYLGFEARPSRSWLISGYIDQFSFPWLKSSADKPTTGNDLLGQITYFVNKKSAFYFRYRYKTKEANVSDANFNQIIKIKATQTFRLDGIYAANDVLKLHSRIDYNYFIDPVTKKYKDGVYIFTDFIYKKLGSRWNATGRIGLFDAKDFNNRIYAYENDVLYSFSIPAISGKGFRYYLQLNYNINRYIEVWARWAQTNYVDRNLISAGGLNEINGNTRNEYKFQVAFKL
jgi:Helix-hairpin-helix motif